MQGKKTYFEKLFSSFQLSERVPKDNFYRRLRKRLPHVPSEKHVLGKAAQEKKFELSFYQEEYERAWQRQQTKHFIRKDS